MKNNIKKTYFWNTLGSGLNSFNSLFFLVIVTRINGEKDAGIFTFCFATATILYVIAQYSGRVFQVTETSKKIKDIDFIVHRVITSFIMILLSLIVGFISKYNEKKLIILFLLSLFKCIEALCDVFHGILQKNNKLNIVGISLFIRSILNILVFLIIDIITKNMVLACISLILTNILSLIAIDIKQSSKERKKEKTDKNNIIDIFKLGFFAFGMTFINTFLVNIQRYVLDVKMKDNYQTIFGIIVMPATVILLLNQFIMQPVITSLKEKYANNKIKIFKNQILKLIILIVVIGIITIVIAYFLGIPFLNKLYGINLQKHLNDLLIILFGAIIYSVVTILSNALIIARKTKVQFYIYIITSFISIIISYILIDKLGFMGAPIGYTFTMFVLLLLYIVTFFVIIKEKN